MSTLTEQNAPIKRAKTLPATQTLLLLSLIGNALIVWHFWPAIENMVIAAVETYIMYRGEIHASLEDFKQEAEEAIELVAGFVLGAALIVSSLALVAKWLTPPAKHLAATTYASLPTRDTLVTRLSNAAHKTLGAARWTGHALVSAVRSIVQQAQQLAHNLCTLTTLYMALISFAFLLFVHVYRTGHAVAVDTESLDATRNVLRHSVRDSAVLTMSVTHLEHARNMLGKKDEKKNEDEKHPKSE